MIRFLTQADAARPTLTRDDRPLEPDVAHGFLTTALPAAELFLHRPAGRWHAVWSAASRPGVARVAVPVGEWRLDGYRFRVADTGGTTWTVAVTRPGLRTLTVTAGAAQAVALPAALQLTFSAERLGGEILLRGAVVGPDGAGATVYRAATQVPAGYRLLDAAGAEVAAGAMAYS